jgi:hypothetical protein
VRGWLRRGAGEAAEWESSVFSILGLLCCKQVYPVASTCTSTAGAAASLLRAALILPWDSIGSSPARSGIA